MFLNHYKSIGYKSRKKCNGVKQGGKCTKANEPCIVPMEQLELRQKKDDLRAVLSCFIARAGALLEAQPPEQEPPSQWLG